MRLHGRTRRGFQPRSGDRASPIAARGRSYQIGPFPFLMHPRIRARFESAGLRGQLEHLGPGKAGRVPKYRDGRAAERIVAILRERYSSAQG